MIELNTVNDEMLGAGMYANRRRERQTLSRHFRHEEQLLEGVLQDVGVAISLLDRPSPHRIQPDVFKIVLSCGR